MYTSVFDQFESIALYRQAPGILLGLLLVIVGAGLLAIGVGAVSRNVRSGFCTGAGLAALAAAALVRGSAPSTSYQILFGIAAIMTLAGPIGVGALVARVARLSV